jgi:hypothetical protein
MAIDQKTQLNPIQTIQILERGYSGMSFDPLLPPLIVIFVTALTIGIPLGTLPKTRILSYRVIKSVALVVCGVVVALLALDWVMISVASGLEAPPGYAAQLPYFMLYGVALAVVLAICIRRDVPQ